MKKNLLFALAAVTICVSQAHAQFDLQITEIWPGNEPGSNLTSDWFEVTNVGSGDYDSASDGFLFFDDDSQDATTADLISGVSTISAGESVIFIDDADTAEFETVWANLTLPQLGTYDGSGLGGGGDGVTLFIGATETSTGNDLAIIDFETYPDADAFGGQSYDVVLGEFSIAGNAAGAVQSAVANDEGQFAVASPGFVAVPEPGCASLLMLAGVAVLSRRRVR